MNGRRNKRVYLFRFFSYTDDKGLGPVNTIGFPVVVLTCDKLQMADTYWNIDENVSERPKMGMTFFNTKKELFMTVLAEYRLKEIWFLMTGECMQ